MKQIQITLISNKGYRPISTLIDVEKVTDYVLNEKKYQDKAITKMLAQRRWTRADLTKYGYTTMKHRVYDKERIEEENALRYERIKEEKGWK